MENIYYMNFPGWYMVRLGDSVYEWDTWDGGPNGTLQYYGEWSKAARAVVCDSTEVNSANAPVYLREAINKLKQEKR